MKVLWYVLSVLIATVIVVGGTAVLVLTGPEHVTALFFLPVISLTAFVYGPLSLGSIRAFWNPGKSDGSRQFFRLRLRWVVGIEIAAAVAIIIYAVIASAPFWLPIVFIGVGAILTGLALFIGKRLHAREAARNIPDLPWTPVTHEQIRAKVTKVVLTFFTTLVVGVVLAVIFGRGSDTQGQNFLLFLLAYAADFAFIASGLACILVTIPLSRRLRESAGKDLGVIRKIAKVVVRGKSVELDEDEKVAAAKYAVLISVILPFTVAYLVLLYCGLAIQQVTSLVNGTGSVQSAVILVGLVVVLVIFLPLYGVRIARARRYARAHADPLPRDSDETALSPG